MKYQKKLDKLAGRIKQHAEYKLKEHGPSKRLASGGYRKPGSIK